MRTLLLNVLALFYTTYGFKVGIGIGDVTGPAAEIGMMGYAAMEQTTKGIHTRQFSRAFIFQNDNDDSRNVFVSVDIGMMGQLVKLEVIKLLRSNPDLKNYYDFDNVVLSATHTHSGPAGFLQYLMFDVSCLGFIPETFDSMVTGIYKSILNAHNNIVPAEVYYNEGKLDDANINRSPTSYEANPQNEKDKYEDGNTDKIFPQLTIFKKNTYTGALEDLMGVINWFAVHPTSMQLTNHLISGDNKGYASYLFEKKINVGKLPGKGNFVAAFASTNLGDVSPNIEGPRCMDTGLPCDLYHSTCNNRTQLCVALGPGTDMFESTQIIGQRQFDKSWELYEKALSEGKKLTGKIGKSHQWVNMTNYKVTLDDGSEATTCPSALGYSFAAGTTDGPGQFDFIQGLNSSNPFWDLISALLKDPTQEQRDCHAPKPILLDVGEMSNPYMWHPHIVDTQIISIGQLLIGAFPGELTTMSGRRMRASIKEEAVNNGRSDEDTKVVMAGLSNTYTHYVTTFEEYQRQRYEAASTIYGPHTLRAYQTQYKILTKALIKGEDMESGTPPPNLRKKQISLVPPVIFDNPQIGHTFGEFLIQPPEKVAIGDTIVVKVISGHPRNDRLQESSFLFINKIEEDGTSTPVVSDADWSTKMEWKRTNLVIGTSEMTFTWKVSDDIVPGTYEMISNGAYKTLIGGVHPYSGKSNQFEVVSKSKKFPRKINRKKSTQPSFFKRMESFITSIFG